MLRRAFVFIPALFAVMMTALPAAPAAEQPATLAIGSAAPDFCLPGIDGATHCLKDYASAKVLVLIFTCNHCPTAQLYEARIKQLVADYEPRGVAFVAIQPNNPNAVRLDELGYTDVGDSFDDMKVRAAYRHFNFPYLDDGETQKIARAYGPLATPHLFIFDAERKLRYEGRVDNNPRLEYVTRQDARLALDAMLARQPVELASTPSVGCSIKWLYKEASRNAALAKIESLPVTVQPANAGDLSALRKNPTGKLLLVDFWATWCQPCVSELPEFETIYRMYGNRQFDFQTVSINHPDEQAGVLRELEKQHATNRNWIFGSHEIYDLIAAFDPDWKGSIPFTALIAPDGKILHYKFGTVDMLELRRLIIANLPDDNYIGHQAYWHETVYGK